MGDGRVGTIVGLTVPCRSSVHPSIRASDARRLSPIRSSRLAAGDGGRARRPAILPKGGGAQSSTPRGEKSTTTAGSGGRPPRPKAVQCRSGSEAPLAASVPHVLHRSSSASSPCVCTFRSLPYADIPRSCSLPISPPSFTLSSLSLSFVVSGCHPPPSAVPRPSPRQQGRKHRQTAAVNKRPATSVGQQPAAAGSIPLATTYGGPIGHYTFSQFLPLLLHPSSSSSSSLYSSSPPPPTHTPPHTTHTPTYPPS